MQTFIRKKNSYSSIQVAPRTPKYPMGDQMVAAFQPIPADNLRTARGRKILQRFIDRLQAIHDQYQEEYS